MLKSYLIHFQWLGYLGTTIVFNSIFQVGNIQRQKLGHDFCTEFFQTQILRIRTALIISVISWEFFTSFIKNLVSSRCQFSFRPIKHNDISFQKLLQYNQIPKTMIHQIVLIDWRVTVLFQTIAWLFHRIASQISGTYSVRFFLCGCLKGKVYFDRSNNIEEMIGRIFDEIRKITLKIISNV